MRKVYLDHNATSPLSPKVLEAMMPYLEEIYGNPSSVHAFGRIARKGIEEAREKVAVLIGAKNPQEIVFTGGGTESDNFAVKGAVESLKSKGDHIITSSLEHHAVLNVCKFLEKSGVKVTYLPVDKQGIVDIEALKESITNKTVLISIMWANNEVGTIEPIEEIAAIAKENKILFHLQIPYLSNIQQMFRENDKKPDNRGGNRNMGDQNKQDQCFLIFLSVKSYLRNKQCSLCRYQKPLHYNH